MQYLLCRISVIAVERVMDTMTTITVLSGSNCATPRGFNKSFNKAFVSPPDKVVNRNLVQPLIFFCVSLLYDEYGDNNGILFLLRCN